MSGYVHRLGFTKCLKHSPFAKRKALGSLLNNEDPMQESNSPSWSHLD